MRDDQPSSKCSEGTQLERSDDVPQDGIALMARDVSGIVQAARIVRIADGFAWFDIGSKFESPIPLTDWEQESQPHVGDAYQVMVDDDCDVADRPLKILRVEVSVTPSSSPWEDTIKSLTIGQLCLGRLVRKIRDGFLVNIGVNALLPEDCAAPELQCNPDTFIGQDFNFRVTSIDNERRTVCVVLVDAITPRAT